MTSDPLSVSDTHAQCKRERENSVRRAVDTKNKGERTSRWGKSKRNLLVAFGGGDIKPLTVKQRKDYVELASPLDTRRVFCCGPLSTHREPSSPKNGREQLLDKKCVKVFWYYFSKRLFLT